MSCSDRERILAKLEALSHDLQGNVDWHWDGRFGTALGEFPTANKDQILAILEQHLVSAWNASNVRDAPDAVQKVVKNLGGLMSGQLLLLSDPTMATFIYCAWWPWGNGVTISIRIAPYSETLAPDDMDAVTETFRGIFKI